MGTILGKMLSSLKLKRNQYKEYEEDIKELRDFKHNESKAVSENRTRSGRMRNPAKRRAFSARRTKVRR